MRKHFEKGKNKFSGTNILNLHFVGLEMCFVLTEACFPMLICSN